ncbi:ABC transporter substrate-binding protein, partial [Streptomyces sp. SID7499]|nr:ABC transporter substrate-binding protein [Streptomyces sp. SID7499]
MKQRSVRSFAAALSVMTVIVSAAACSTKAPNGTDGRSPQNAKIALLMPDIASTRYELYDAPLFKAKMK